ncbi:MAG: T9SS type A sorting domain-containing protein, partial [Ginsengibacter sp.]
LLKIKANTDWIVRMLSNPVRGNVNVLLRGITGTVKLSIKDITGKTVFTNTYQNTNGQITLNANLQSGTYILVAENNNERKITKFIK